MAPAPFLPSVMDEDEASLSPVPWQSATPSPAVGHPTVSAPVEVHAEPVAAPPPAAHQAFEYPPQQMAVIEAPRPVYRSSGNPFAEVFAGVAEQQARLSTLHQNFLSDQTDIQTQFLAMQERIGKRIRRNFEGRFQAPRYDEGSASAWQQVPDQAPQIEWTGAQTPAAWAPEAPAPAPVHQPATPSWQGVPAPSAPAAETAHAASPAEVAVTVHVEQVPSGPALPGPKFNRAQLEAFSQGHPLPGLLENGPQRVRLPAAPLLLIDRVTGLEAGPTAGTIWTETDVQDGRWFVEDEGRIPPGLLLEAAQGYLLLVRALGAEAAPGDARVARVLEMDLTFHEALPDSRDQLRFESRVESLGLTNGAPTFSWHTDCRAGELPRMTVSNARVALLTSAELADAPGLRWDPETATPRAGAKQDAPELDCVKRSFTPEEVQAFANGRSGDTFAPIFRRAYAHTRSPSTPRGQRQLLHNFPEFNPHGGPWGRGYLRAETTLSPSDWFFATHARTDHSMPESLMLEGCLQAMEFYLGATGFTVERDGWRFEPVLDEPISLRWNGQVTPGDHLLVWEVFVEELSASPLPTVYADLVLTVDGRQVFHAKRAGVRLVLEHPEDHWERLGPRKEQETTNFTSLRELGGLVGYFDPRALRLPDGGVLDYRSMVHGSWGGPGVTYGTLYKDLYPLRRLARGPAPPYQFLTRVVSLDGPLGQMKSGLTVELEYDVPSLVWYFQDNGYPVMPWCVFMEIVLQGCGWLAIGLGSFFESDIDLMFRNLDGTGTLTKEVLPTSGTLKARVKVTNISKSAGIIIQSFETSCFLGEERIYTMDTVFGFFPKEAFDNQVGLPVSAEQKERIAAPPVKVIDLTSAPAKYCGGSPRLAGTLLRMLDRIIEFNPTGGKKGLGYVRGEKDINPDEWFFKAHFFRDPVQPGSLGHEAFVQLAQFFMIEQGMGKDIPNARFEPIMLGRKLWWRYRGQITPSNLVLNTEIEITEIGQDEKGPFVVCEAWLWADGKCIYQCKNLGMRIVQGEAPVVDVAPAQVDSVLDTEVDPWIKDHCPTWTMPSLPAMSMIDLLASAAEKYTGKKVVGLSGIQVRRWLAFPKSSVPIRTEVSGTGDTLDVTLYAWREASNAAMSRFEVVASGKVTVGELDEAPMSPLPPLADAQPAPSPYGDYLFHGPAFQMLESLRIGPTGSSAILRAEKGGVTYGALNQGLLDAATHAIPHGHLQGWSSEIEAGQVGYPYRVPFLHVFKPLPTEGEVRVEVRFVGFDGDVRTPMMDVQMIHNDEVYLSLRLVEVLLPQGRLMRSTAEQRLGFLVEKRYVHDLSLSEFDGPISRLKGSEVSLMDWIPGNVAWAYNIPRDQRTDLNAQVAIREHIAHRACVHPRTVSVDRDLSGGVASVRPLRRYPVKLTRHGQDVEVIDAGPPEHYYAPVRDFWRNWHGLSVCPPEDIYEALGDRFLGDLVIVDPEALDRIKGRACLYLANHQVGIESLVFTVLSQAFTHVPTSPLAKAEHRTSYLQWIRTHSSTYPGVKEAPAMIFFEREDLASLLDILEQSLDELKANTRSILVHVEGTRSTSCQKPVHMLSSGFIDLALKADVPIVPVRFIGGLPVEPVETRLEFPYGYGRQDYWIGKPIMPDELRGLRYRDRKQMVLDAINGLGIPALEERPMSPDPAFGRAVEDWIARTGARPEYATIYVALTMLKNPEEDTKAVLEGARTGKLVVDSSPRGRWKEELARKLYGDRGPTIEVIP